MKNISNHDIRDHFVIPAMAGYANELDIDGITDVLLESYPLQEWTYDPETLQFAHPELDNDEFALIVLTVARRTLHDFS